MPLKRNLKHRFRIIIKCIIIEINITRKCRKNLKYFKEFKTTVEFQRQIWSFLSINFSSSICTIYFSWSYLTYIYMNDDLDWETDLLSMYLISFPRRVYPVYLYIQVHRRVSSMSRENETSRNFESNSLFAEFDRGGSARRRTIEPRFAFLTLRVA